MRNVRGCGCVNGFEGFYTGLQIANTKSVDNKTTLLHFLADMVEKRFPFALDFSEEVTHAEPASKGLLACGRIDLSAV